MLASIYYTILNTFSSSVTQDLCASIFARSVQKVRKMAATTNQVFIAIIGMITHYDYLSILQILELTNITQ